MDCDLSGATETNAIMKNLSANEGVARLTGADRLLKKEDYLLAKVMLGAPSRRCEGMGVCKITLIQSPDSAYDLWGCKSALALIVPGRHNNWKLFFLKGSMCAQMAQRYFGGGTFRIDEGSIFERPETGSLLFLAGVYPVIETEKYFIVKAR